MIQFTCLCGEKMEVPAELAGDMLQCPVCMRLVDVPRLNDAPGIEDDGTVRLNDAIATPSDLADKFRTFGHREDLRESVNEFQIARSPAGQAGKSEPGIPVPRSAPRYDPITGELMVPVELANDFIPKPPPPMAPGAPVLGYARSAVPDNGTGKSVPWWSMPWRLVTGWSAIALLMIWVAHAVAVIGLTLPGLNIFFLVYALILTLVIMAHYANTVEDFGPNDRDRVPVLLRGVSMGEDVLSPLSSLLIAFLYSFGPMILGTLFAARSIYRFYPGIGIALFAWGVLLFPVSAFTMICGGVWQNLAPKRMVSVIVAAPGRYLMASLTFYLACAAYLYACGLIQFAPPTSLVPSATSSQLIQQTIDLTVNIGLFAVPVYLMHLAAAWLGLIFRIKGEKFDWVLQRHDRTYRGDAVSNIMKNRGPRPVVTQVPPAGPKRLGFEVKA